MELIGSGREADVFALDEARVLRRSRLGGDVSREVELMGYVASLGFPVPTVFEGAGTDMVLERLYGPTMLEELLTGRMDPAPAGQALAELHNMLHALPAFESLDPSHRVLHLDLHPGNVILTERGPVVIDWRDFVDGPPGYDTAVTVVILSVEALVNESVREPAQLLLSSFLSQVIDSPVSYLEQAVGLRRRNPTMSVAEIEALEDVPSAVMRYLV